MHSDDDLSQKLEPATPEATAEAGPSNDELVGNSHDESGVGVLDGEIRSPERQNVSAVRDAIEAQAEMEIGKTIEEKEDEMATRGDGPYGDKEVKDNAAAQEVTAKPGTQIIINIASEVPREKWQCLNCGNEGELSVRGQCAACGSEAVSSMPPAAPPAREPEYARRGIEAGKKEQPIGGEKQHPRENTSANGMFGGTSLSATPNMEKHAERPQEGYAGHKSLFEGAAPSPDTVARVRGQYTSGMGRQSCMDYFKITEQQLDDILSGKYGKGKIATYHELKAAFLKNASLFNEANLKQAGQEYLHMVRTAAINVAQGQDEQGFHMLLTMNGREYVLRGTDADSFRKEYAAIPKPEAAVNKLVEKYLWKMQPYQKQTIQHPPSETKQDPNSPALRRQRSEELADADAYWGGKEKGPNDYKRYMTQHASAKLAATSYAEYQKLVQERNQIISQNRSRQMKGQPPSPVPPKPQPPMVPVAYAADGTYEGRLQDPVDCPAGCTVKWEPSKGASMMSLAKMAADHFGYDDWITGHTALMINNDSAGLTTLHNLVRNALKKKMTPKELAGQFARLFKKFGEQSKKFYAENAENARGERGKHEREQLEGVVKSPSGNKARDFVDSITNMWYDAGGQSDWEQPSNEVNWEEIATAEMESERAENPDKYPQTNKQDDKMLDNMGIKMESLRTATAVLKRVAAMSVPEKHQLRIAIDSLKMNPAMLGVMGGPSKEEALQILAKHGLRWDDEDYMAGGKGVKKAAAEPYTYDQVSPTRWQVNQGKQFIGIRDSEQGAIDSVDKYNKEEAAGLPPVHAGEGAAKTPEEIEKEAGFNFFFPGQVLREIAPELQHELVDYPNQTNTPMQYPDIVGDKDEVPEEIALAAALEGALDTTIIAYVSTSPAAAAGIGRDGKPEVLEGAPLRKENDIRGMMFTDEFYGQQTGVPGKAFASGKAAGFVRPGSALAYLKSLKLGKVAGADEAKQFSIFLQYVCGEIAATLVALFKVTYRPMLNQVPGKGEIQLAQVEQPQGLSSFNIYNQASRVKYLMNKLTDSEIKDAINSSSAQGAVWHEGEEGGYVYEVFVRIDDIDTESLIATYSFICGTKE
jgi:rRNA maturation endonuclease Nob1